MNIFRKTRLAFLLIILQLIMPLSSFAEVLGDHIYTVKTEIAQGTTLYKNAFYDSTVGKQTEHFVEYSKSKDVLPILTNGWSAYGKRTLTQANSILKQLGYNTAMGINADFFSLQTGVPMSNTLIDGRVYTKDSSWNWGIGFKNDGTAFTAKFPIATTLSLDDGSYFTIECINKYRQPYAIYLFNSDFSDETHTSGAGKFVVLGDVSGDIKLGQSITAVVEEIFDYDGSVKIPEGKIILSCSGEASQEIKDRFNCLDIGKEVTITTNAAENAELWDKAKYAIGLTGGKLITNGKLDFEDDGAAPRSAIGIKKDGNIIFYTIDGRQSGYSYGARKETLARRLLELGCVEAVNLDGGGSTTMGATMPGTTEFKIVNSPSDKTQRSVANFFFLLKLIEPTGIPYKLVMNNYGALLLSGASVDVSVVSAYDTSYGPAKIPEEIEYYIETDAGTPEGSDLYSSVDKNGTVSVRGNGDIYIGSKSGDAIGSTMVSSITTPHSISVYNADRDYPVNELIMEPGSSVSLTAESFWYGEKLISDSSCYKWTIVSDDTTVGSIESNGVFHASDISGSTGTLNVSAGTCTTEIPIVILEGGTSAKETGYPFIDGSVEDGILTAFVISPEMTADNIRVTVDAKEVPFKYDQKKYRLECEVGYDDGYHRIGVFAESQEGNSSMWFYDSGNINSFENNFSDTEGHWASGYISYLADCGIVKGSLENEDTILFKPSNNMTRCEFAIMLCNYLGVDLDKYKDVTLPFTDNDQIPWWAEDNIKAIYSLGIMKGQLNEVGVAFNPSANINRMEFAISLSRLLPKGLKSSPITSVDKDDIPFWAEESMRMIVTQKIMTGYPDGTLLPLQSVTRAEAVKMLFNVFGI